MKEHCGIMLGEILMSNRTTVVWHAIGLDSIGHTLRSGQYPGQESLQLRSWQGLVH